MPNACVAFTFHPLQACVFASECVHKRVSCVCGMCVCVRVCFWPQYDCCWWCRLLTKCPSGMQHCCFHAAFKCGGIFISFLLLLSLSPCLSLYLVLLAFLFHSLHLLFAVFCCLFLFFGFLRLALPALPASFSSSTSRWASFPLTAFHFISGCCSNCCCCYCCCRLLLLLLLFLLLLQQ